MQEWKGRLGWIIRSPGTLHHYPEWLACFRLGDANACHCEERQCGESREKEPACCHESSLLATVPKSIQNKRSMSAGTLGPIGIIVKVSRSEKLMKEMIMLTFRRKVLYACNYLCAYSQ
jgi:hypothetical protein